MPDRSIVSSNIPDLSALRQIETQLHTKVEAARIEYQFASEIYKRTLSQRYGNGDSQLTIETSISQVTKAQRKAFEKYRRALDEFNKFIIYGDLPGHPDSN